MIKNERLTIFLPFFLCVLLFVPLGLFNEGVDPFEHSGFFSLTTIDAGDDQGYYAYVRSFFFDGDIDFLNERNYAYYFHLTQTNYALNLWPSGQALLWAPFFLVGELVEKILVYFEMSQKTYGYGWSHLISTGLGTLFYVFCGFLLLYKTLSSMFSKRAALWSCWTLFLSSPLPYFTFIRSRMGHFAEFFTLSLILYIWLHRPKPENSTSWGLCLGCVLALVGMSRYTNIIVGIFPIAAFILVICFIPKQSENLETFTKTCGSVLFTFLVTISIQVFIWMILYGNFYPDDPHLSKFKTIVVPDSFSFLWERLVSVFGGPYFGLLWCFQPWLIGYVGLFCISPEKFKIKPLFGISLPEGLEAKVFKILAIILTFWSFYLTLTWTLAEFSSYGRRLLILSIPFVSLGLAALFDRIETKFWKRVLACSCVLFVLINIIHMVQFRWLIAHDDPNYSFESFKKIPDMFSTPGGMFSTSFVKILYLKTVSLNSSVDFFFIILFPLLVLFLMWGAWKLCGVEVKKVDTTAKYQVWIPLLVMVLIVFSIIYLDRNRISYSEASKSNRMRFASIMQTYPEFIFDSAYVGKEADALAAIKLMPKSSRAFFQLGYFYLKEGDLPKAIRFLKKSIELDSLNHNAYWALGIASKKSGQPDYMKYMKTALTIQPHRNYRLGYLFEVSVDYFQRGRYIESIEVLDKVIWLAPNWAGAYKSLAINYYYLKDFQKSKYYADLASGLGADVNDILKLLKPLS
jgi:hypothetical protein